MSNKAHVVFRNYYIIPIVFILLSSCKEKTNTSKVYSESSITTENKITYKNKGHELVAKLAEKVGTYSMLRAQKDVVYTYTYKTPDGKSDVSLEKYVFDGELSYGKYEQHQRTLPQFEGVIEQSYDGKDYWLKHNGKIINYDAVLKQVAFNRPTNFYWFTMFQKLLDPGLDYNYLGDTVIDGKTYDIIKISFESNDGLPKDIYQIYINKKSGLVDQFLFTVADYGVMDTPFLMKIDYEKVDDFLIPTKRKYKKSTWDAEITDAPWILVNWSNIKFNNGLKQTDFDK